MNKKQKIILLSAAVAIAIMILYPPYVVKNIGHMIIKTGYGFIFDLPPYVAISSVTNDVVVIPAMVNVSTLFIQISGVLVVAGLLYFSQKKS